MTLLRSGSSTDTGLVRSVNQDLAVESPSLFAVADGMGGHAGGEVASRLAIEALRVAFGRRPSGAGLSDAVTEANTTVWQHSQENPELRGMGTTLTAMAVVNEDGNDVLALVNVGDSRSYRFHNGEMTQITTDHSLAEEMVRTGELTSAEAAVHPHRHILTRALGVSPEVTVDLWKIQPVRGDRYLLCSDGLTNELDTAQIAEVLSSVADPRRAAELLVRAARTHGGSDNITVVVVDVVVGEDGDASAPAVAAVASDFRTASPEAEGPAGEQGEGAPASPPVVPAPSRRERRRAKRRERRAARGRRLITFRTLLFVILFGAVIAGAYYAVRWYDTNSYFVGVNNHELVIYQGRVGGFLWYHPAEIERTGVTTADVPAEYAGALGAGVQESSVRAARTYVANLVNDTKCQQNPTNCTSATTTTPSVPATTAVPAPSTTKVT
ncbi:MAG TPA: Stp1/IreP family PP2C-type Ser/Thr phosphatase [Acidimicrobiales bacterium]|nr:Stp1/IreP family PP2C-type Ser/Thr phosphatase [Acidimicrobiales bacterium]